MLEDCLEHNDAANVPHNTNFLSWHGTWIGSQTTGGANVMGVLSKMANGQAQVEVFKGIISTWKRCGRKTQIPTPLCVEIREQAVFFVNVMRLFVDDLPLYHFYLVLPQWQS